jgi:hypothetical protein
MKKLALLLILTFGVVNAQAIKIPDGYDCAIIPNPAHVGPYEGCPPPVTATGSNVITGTSHPKCDGDYQLVMTSAGTPMCAHDLKEPTR